MAYRGVFVLLIFVIRQETNAIFPLQPKMPGKFLPEKGKFRKCLKEGADVDVGFPLTCTKCICKDGVVSCSKPQCPPVQNCKGIVVKKPDACCAECQEGDRCLYQGIEYKNGDTWYGHKCTTCSCNKGVVKCDQVACEQNLKCPEGMKKGLRPGACCESCVEETGMCTSFGDPHYQTFDNRMYNFQGKCKYVLAKDCATNNFTIQAKNEGRHSRTFSWTKSVFLHIHGMEIALLQNLRVKVNGELVSLPYYRQPDLYIKKDGYLMTVTTSIGVEIVWDGDSYSEIHVPKRYQNKTCGFCGNFNGDPDDDFQTPEGVIKENTNEFAVSWQVKNKKMSSCDEEEKASPPHHPPPCRGENLIQARAKCVVLKNTNFAQCHNVVDPRPHFQSCVNDMCYCPRSQVHSCLCQSVTAYARVCKKEGINIRWRSKSVCGIKCKGGAIYDDCGPACRRTCHNKDDVNKVCNKPCVAGCQCPAGKVWHKKKCVSPSKCPKSKKKKTYVH